jgi:hypothetical protein
MRILKGVVVVAGLACASQAHAFEQGENVHVANVFIKSPWTASTNIFDATSKTPVVSTAVQWNDAAWTAQIGYISGMQRMEPGAEVTDPDMNAPQYQIFCAYDNNVYSFCSQSPGYRAGGILVDENTGALSLAPDSANYWAGGSFRPAVRDRKIGIPDVDGAWFAHSYSATDGKKWLTPDDPFNFLFIRRPNDADTALTCTLDGGVSVKLVLQKYPTMKPNSSLVLTYGDDGSVAGVFRFDDNTDLIGWKTGLPGTKAYGDSTSVDRVTGDIVVANSANQSRIAGHCAIRSTTHVF